MLSGNTYTPTDTNDDGTAGTLRAAIAAANADPGAQADTIQLSSGTYMLTLGELEVTNTAHALVIDGQGSSGPNATDHRSTLLGPRLSNRRRRFGHV